MFNPEDFRHLKKELLASIEKNGIEGVTSYCVLAGMPLTVAYTLIAEDLPEHSELCKQRVESLNEFYGIK